jgi:membrane protein
LLWVNYSSMILLFGAEFTRVYAEKHGSRIGLEPHEVDANAKQAPDPKTAGRDGAPEAPARVPTTRGDVQPQSQPAQREPERARAANTEPRPSGRPL